MAVLFCLAERAGEVVSREELMGRVWPGVVVGNEVLTQAVISCSRRSAATLTRRPPSRPSPSAATACWRMLAPVMHVKTPPAVQAKSVASHRIVLAVATLSGLVLLMQPAYLGRSPDPAPPAAESQSPQHGNHATLTVMPFESYGEAPVPTISWLINISASTFLSSGTSSSATSVRLRQPQGC